MKGILCRLRESVQLGLQPPPILPGLVPFPESFYLQDPLCFPFYRVSYQNPAFDRVHHVIGPPLLIENTACSKMYLFFSFTHVRASRRGL